MSQTAHGTAAASGTATDNPVAQGFDYLLGDIEATILETAALATDALLAFRPSHDVRTFGQTLGHIAGAQNALFAGVAGKNVPPTSRPGAAQRPPGGSCAKYAWLFAWR